jgi:hypothetical protein
MRTICRLLFDNPWPVLNFRRGLLFGCNSNPLGTNAGEPRYAASAHTVRRGRSMPRYFFMTQWPDGRSDDAGTTSLPNDAAARRYAHLLIRDLRENPDYRDPGLKLFVRNGDGELLHAIALWADRGGSR